MPEVLLTLAETRRETPDVRSFVFTPSAPVGHRAGQYLMLRMDAPGDPRGPSRTFTISSSPTEGDRIMITTRVSPSPFKQRLAGLPPGTELRARAPMGTFALHEDASKRAIFLAGGIGITSFRAMIRYAMDADLPHEILLLYSCRTVEEIALRRELEMLAARNPRFRMVITVTRPAESVERWDGPTSRIDAQFLKEHAGPLDDAIVYAAGPPATVEYLLRAALSLGVPNEKTRAERFTGY